MEVWVGICLQRTTLAQRRCLRGSLEEEADHSEAAVLEVSFKKDKE